MTLRGRLTETTPERVSGLTDSYIIRNLVGALRIMPRDRTTAFYFAILVGVTFLGVVGPIVAPYGIQETQYDPATGQILQAAGPSLAHPLGTTFAGYDVLSRLLVGARPTVITGLLGGAMILTIGTAVGVTAGYVGGRTETVLMRFTDFVYGVPLIPFAIVLIAFLGVGFWASILVIGVILWRGNARVLRSQVLQIKERPYIMAAKAVGAGDLRIVMKHVLPNVASMAVLFFSLGIGFAIIFQAGLAFIGVSNPFIPSWGIMTRNAYTTGLMAQAPWWALQPGLLISITVLSTFLLGRGYERVSEGGADQETAGV